MRMTKAARGHSLGGRLAAWLACAAIVAGLVSSVAPAEAVEESRGAAPQCH
jgi:esterase/lipase